MRPVEPRDPSVGRRMVFVGPPGSGIEPLVAIENDGEIRTEWDLSFNERRAILEGARVLLTFQGAMPPCRIEIEGVNE